MVNGEVISFPGRKPDFTEDVAMRNIEEQLAKIESYVLDNPAKSLAIALIAGFVLGLLGRRS